jgi:uncharacterized protein (DUF1697 family)
MPELVKIFTALRCADVVTYVNSGNVVFTAPAALAKSVPAAVTAAVARKLGFAPAVVVRDARALAAIAASSPFPTDVGKQLHVAFLGATPSVPLSALAAAAAAGEQLSLRGRDLYLYLPNGVGKSRMSNTLIENKLGVVATMRNWNTVVKLADLTAR